MRATFVGQKPIFMIDDVPEHGRFALDAIPPKQPTWEKCREKFAALINIETTGFFFSHKTNQSENVAGFIAKSEEILDLPQRSQFSSTDQNIVMWVEPTPFWMDCWIKRSFLTILLRCGMYYDPELDNYEDALFGNGDDKDQAREYTHKTKLAVLRFMFGFTKFVMPSDISEPTGNLQSKLWVEVFRERSIKELKTILVAQNPISSFGSLGTDAIWA